MTSWQTARRVDEDRRRVLNGGDGLGGKQELLPGLVPAHVGGGLVHVEKVPHLVVEDVAAHVMAHARQAAM